MNIDILTTPANVEAANCLLGQAIKLYRESEQERKDLGISMKHVEAAEKFRKSLLKAFLK